MRLPTLDRLAVLLATLALTSSTAIAGEIATTDGVPHVRNSDTPADGVRTLQLEEVWRRGGEDDEDVLFGVIFQVLADADGNTYLLDTQLSQVEVFDPRGEHLTTLSREGDGPGEVRRPTDMFVTDDGRLALAVSFPGRLVYLDSEGEPAGDVTVHSGDPAAGGFTILRACRHAAGRTVVGVTLVSTDQAAGKQVRHPTIADMDAEGNLNHFYHRSSYEISFSNFTFDESEQLDIPLRRFTMDTSGRVYVAPDRERYLIEVYEPGGGLERIIERDYPEHRRTAEELEDWRRLYAASMRNQPIEVNLDLCRTAAPIDWIFGGLWAREDGNLWVRTSRSAVDQPAGIMLTYDVFDTDGHFTEQIRIACPGDGKEDALFFAGSDRMILVTGFMDAVRAMFGGVEGDDGDEPLPMEVICYKVS